MGSSASVTRQLERFKEKDLANQVAHDCEISTVQQRYGEKILELHAHMNDTNEQLREAKKAARIAAESQKNEHKKNIELMFGGLPHQLVTNSIEDTSQLCRNYDMVTFAHCDIVGFSSFTAAMQPEEVIKLIDKFQAVVDEAFNHDDIFVMERWADGFIAACGLVDCPNQENHFSPCMDSSCGSDATLVSDEDSQIQVAQLEDNNSSDVKPASHYASILASSTLQLLSLSSSIKTSHKVNKPLQIRIALHSGPCTAGVIGLQTRAGSARIPQYKLWGHSLQFLKQLCETGLALQIRTSKTCWSLLKDTDRFHFERCPDLVRYQKPIESFWLVGEKDVDLSLPTIDDALSLSEYI